MSVIKNGSIKNVGLQRHSSRKLANQKHCDPLNTEIRDKYHITLKIYKNTLKHKKELFHEKKQEELERVSENDPNSFWKLLKNMSDDFEDPSMSKPDVSANSWLTHFESLHAKHTLGTEQNNILQKLTKLEEEIPNNFLDEPISEVEVLSAAKKLKNNKSAYSDRIKNEMLKCSVKILLKLYQKLFNLVLETGHFPDQWCEGLITPIFKSGDKTDPNNYRGICVTSCLSKFLCIILNQRLSKFSIDRNIIHPSQIGFQSGHRTADHIFTLKTIIDKHINQNKKEKLYACFVDFRKAFDSVWHEGLFLNFIISIKIRPTKISR
jgi:hypothetical protein